MNQDTSNAGEKRWPVLLREEPADKDRVESFEKLARAAADMIREMVGGVTVCINGPWGTGKSTFVKILASALTGQGESPFPVADASKEHAAASDETFDPYVFVYDAWAHSGDPLRRAFLISLLRGLRRDAKWLPCKQRLLSFVGRYWTRSKRMPDKWDALSERLAGRSKEVQKTSRFSIGLWGRFVLLAGFFWAVQDTILKEALKLHPIVLTETQKTYGAAAILLIAVGLILWPNGLSAVLANKGNTSEKVSTSEEPVPTSIEFAEYFKEIVGAALRGKSGRRLVIVLDNLDRLGKIERESAWSFLRSFIDNSSIAAETWYKNIWVVVPWATAKSIEDTQSSPQAQPVGGVEMDAGLSEKLFQIKLDLPPPTLFFWEKALKESLLEAFGGAPERFYPIVRIFHSKYVDDAGITMRRITKFVNDVVVLKYQHPEMSLPTLAAFVAAGGRDIVGKKLQEGERFEDLQKIISESTQREFNFDSIERDDDDPEMVEQFAVLYYGLSDRGMAMNRALVPAWVGILARMDIEGAIHLLRNRSSVNALRLLAENHLMWSEEGAGEHAFRMLSFVGRFSKNRRAHPYLRTLTLTQDWQTILSAARDAMTMYAPSAHRTLYKAYAAYLRITVPTNETRDAVIRSIEKIVDNNSAKIEAYKLVTWLLVNCGLVSDLNDAGRMLTVPFKGTEYLEFCEKFVMDAADRHSLTVKSLYEQGAGNWAPQQGWSPVADGLRSWSIDASSVRALPVTWRSANAEILMEAVDSLVAGVCNIGRPSDGNDVDLTTYETVFWYLLVRLGASKVLEVVGAANVRRRLFFALDGDDSTVSPSSDQVFIFLLLLVGGNSRPALPLDAEINDESWNERNLGHKRFRTILTDVHAISRFAAALERLRWATSVLGPLPRVQESDITGFWNETERTIRANLQNRFPDKPRSEAELKEVIFAIEGIDRAGALPLSA